MNHNTNHWIHWSQIFANFYSSNVLMNPPRKPAPLQFPHKISLLPLQENIYILQKESRWEKSTINPHRIQRQGRNACLLMDSRQNHLNPLIIQASSITFDFKTLKGRFIYEDILDLFIWNYLLVQFWIIHAHEKIKKA